LRGFFLSSVKLHERKLPRKIVSFIIAAARVIIRQSKRASTLDHATSAAIASRLGTASMVFAKAEQAVNRT
jgi:hypothetical protein